MTNKKKQQTIVARFMFTKIVLIFVFFFVAIIFYQKGDLIDSETWVMASFNPFVEATKNNT